MYIAAGKKRLEEVRATDLAELRPSARKRPAWPRTRRPPRIWPTSATGSRRSCTTWS